MLYGIPTLLRILLLLKLGEWGSANTGWHINVHSACENFLHTQHNWDMGMAGIYGLNEVGGAFMS